MNAPLRHRPLSRREIRELDEIHRVHPIGCPCDRCAPRVLEVSALLRGVCVGAPVAVAIWWAVWTMLP